MGRNIDEFVGSDKIKIICIQGASGSGKTTLASKVSDCLREQGKNVFVFSMDMYFKTAKSVVGTNFDNPSSLDWDKMNETLKAFNDGMEEIPLYEHDFASAVLTGPFYVKNTFPEYLIIDGIYSFWLFEKSFFDLNYYSPFDNYDTKDFFKTNPFKFEKFTTFKIMLTVCLEKMLEVKIKRDTVERGRTVDMVTKQVVEMSWPAYLRWILPLSVQADCLISHGTFNEDHIEGFISSLHGESFAFNENKLCGLCNN